MSFSDLPPAPPPTSGGGAGYGAPAERGPRPDTVTNAVRLMFAQVALSLLGLIALFATKSDYEDRIRENTPNASDSTVNAAIAVVVVIAVVFAVLYALLAMQVGKGRNWARIVTWVLAGLGIISGFTQFGQPQPPVSRILGIIGLVVEIAIVILLALKASNDYFKRPTVY